MKKLDKLILKSVVGPFLLTFVTVVFILLTQYMLKYFDDFVGKDLGAGVFAELIFYFSINMTPMALPLAVLLSSLMTFGNLGEHFELTAIKGAGISLTRTLIPLFFFVLFLSFLAFLSNNYVVPRANLKAYSLLYDVKQKKPALDIQEGVFYGGIPKFRIKVNKKHDDGETIEEVIIYDHSQGQGNNMVIIANSGKMYTFDHERFLRLELFDGNRYSEGADNRNRSSSGGDKFVRTNFDTTKMTFSLASFGLQRTKEEYFASHRRMQNMAQLAQAIDSMQREQRTVRHAAFVGSNRFYRYHLRYDSLMPAALAVGALKISQSSAADTLLPDSAVNQLRGRGMFSARLNDTLITSPATKTPEIKDTEAWRAEALAQDIILQPKHIVEEVDTALLTRVDRSIDASERSGVIAKALSQSRTIKNELQINSQKLRRLKAEINKSVYESGKKVTQAVSCLIMFLIGAPLGAIIKRGGLGMPVLISVAFFIAFYVLGEMSRKWAEELVMDPQLAVWFPNLVLLPIGIVLLIQARLDTRLLETDFYRVWAERIVKRFTPDKKPRPVEQKVA
ncbi:MAG: LptF/LptG family permease [Tunicatimonas sp.]